MWSDLLKIGVENIDEQHEMLFTKVELLIDDVLDTGEYQKEHIIATIRFLKDYAVTHFADEEAYQRSINDKNYSKHKKMHDHFTSTVLWHEKKMTASNFAYTDVSAFAITLFTWLVHHVSDIDQKIGVTEEDEAEAAVSHTDIICECFTTVINSILDARKKPILQVQKHNETFDGSIAVKYSFDHNSVRGDVVFDYSASFINKLMLRLLTEIPSDENKIRHFKDTFLLKTSNVIVQNIYRALNAGEHKINEGDIFIMTDETSRNEKRSGSDERFAFETGIGIIEVRFSNK